MRSSKSRSRNKNRNTKPQGNVVNRVFDSSGPEGKVRGTPQQIIDKYNQLARDAQLSGDRVASENFQQHAEHYLRMLSEAQREQETRREDQERQNRERQAQRDRERQERIERQERESNIGQKPTSQDDPGESPQPDVIESTGADSGLVETPEEKASSAAGSPTPTEEKPKRARRPRKPKAPKTEGEPGGSQATGEAKASRGDTPHSQASNSEPPSSDAAEASAPPRDAAE